MKNAVITKSILIFCQSNGTDQWFSTLPDSQTCKIALDFLKTATQYGSNCTLQT